MMDGRKMDRRTDGWMDGWMSEWFTCLQTLQHIVQRLKVTKKQINNNIKGKFEKSNHKLCET